MIFTISCRAKLPIAIFTCFMAASIALNYKVFRDGLSTLSNATLNSATETAHGDITILAATSLKPEIDALMRNYAEANQNISWKDFVKERSYIRFDAEIRRIFRNTNVLKIKLFAADGITIFSTDPTQVGEDQSAKHEVTHALRGRPTTEFEFREKFVGISRTLNNVEVISSYHPLYVDDATIIGVVELYSDVSDTFLITETRTDISIAYSILSLTSTLTVWFVYLLYGSIRRRENDFGNSNT